MKLKYIFMSMLAVVAAGAFTACDDNDYDPTLLDEVKVSSSYVSIPMDGGATTIDVVTTGDWTLSDTPDWLTVSPTSGSAGTTQVTFSADATLDGRETELLLNVSSRTQHIWAFQGIVQASSATVAEIMAGPEKNYRVTGKVTAIANTTYGNWYLNDGTSETPLYIYGTLDKNGNAGQNNSIAAWGIEVGDEITVEGPKQLYGSTVELVNVTVKNITKSLIKVDSVSTTKPIPVEGGTVTIYLSCKGTTGINCSLPIAAQDWLHVVAMEGGVPAYMTFRAHPNTGASRSVPIVFRTKDTAGKEYFAQITIEQDGMVKGTGTESDPYNVVGITSYTKSLDKDVTSDEVIYVKGIISSIKNAFDAEHGTAIYNISDDGTTNGEFTVYSSYYLGNRAWVEGDDQIKVGDEVIVAGNVVYFKGTTPEFASKKSCLISLNGKMAVNAVSVVDFVAAPVGESIYSMSGIISRLYYYKESVAGFYIQDWSGETLIYSPEGYTGAEAKVGDIVTAEGKRSEFKGAAQMAKGGKFTLNYAVSEISIADFLTKEDSKDAYYMVTGTVSSLLDNKGRENDYGNLYLKDGDSELYVYGCYPGYGAQGDNRKGFIKAAGIEVGDKLTMIGYKDTFNGTIELCGGIYVKHEKAAE